MEKLDVARDAAAKFLETGTQRTSISGGVLNRAKIAEGFTSDISRLRSPRFQTGRERHGAMRAIYLGLAS